MCEDCKDKMVEICAKNLLEITKTYHQMKNDENSRTKGFGIVIAFQMRVRAMDELLCSFELHDSIRQKYVDLCYQEGLEPIKE